MKEGRNEAIFETAIPLKGGLDNRDRETLSTLAVLLMWLVGKTSIA